MLKIAHISDLHLFVPTFEIADFFSKRLLGQLNYFLKRKAHFEGEQLLKLKDLFQSQNIEYVFVSGDLSSTSMEAEFKLARNLFKEMEKVGIKCFFVPGNHDHYTKEAQKKKLFYQYFTNHNPHKLLSLKEEGLEAHLLKEGVWYLGLDTSLPTGWLSSHGVFSCQLETALTNLLIQIPSSDKIIMVNHFPVLDITSSRKTLRRKEALAAILKKHPNVILYLHGHTHEHAIEDFRKDHLPIVLDSGSTALNTIGRLNLLSLEDKKLEVKVFGFKDEWSELETQSFEL